MVATGAGACLTPSVAHGQACCAGGSVVTPGRLELHELALAGLQLKASDVLGSYTTGGRFIGSPSGDREIDLEQDLFGAVRVLPRGQVALLVPLVETYRSQSEGSGIGGGVGDVNASLRYDIVLAGESSILPGIAMLAGITAPTGRPPESATPPLNVDATGIGAWQWNEAVALEQVFGPWLVNATAIVAERSPRFGQRLGTQVTLLAAAAYTFTNEVAIALSASYAFEGAAIAAGAPVADSSKRLTAVTASCLWPITDDWRLLGAVTLDPPVDVVSSNQPASLAFALTIIRSWL